jgi:hypothetical protein
MKINPSSRPWHNDPDLQRNPVKDERKGREGEERGAGQPEQDQGN